MSSIVHRLIKVEEALVCTDDMQLRELACHILGRGEEEEGPLGARFRWPKAPRRNQHVTGYITCFILHDRGLPAFLASCSVSGCCRR